MNDYQEIIEKQLSQFMPKFALMSINEMEQYTNEAPDVKGYFKFIKVRYIRRIKQIKKLCIEYINTYAEGALHLAKNMDDTKLQSAQESLAKDLDFKVVGASTNDEEKSADTKSGVLFLTGDKALKDRLATIVEKIKTIASKNESLTAWANLMILESKIMATDIIYDKTISMIKSEKAKAAAKQKKEDTMKKIQEENKKLQEELNKKSKDLEELQKKYDDVNALYNNSRDELIKLTQGVTEKDLEQSPVAEGDKKDEGGKLSEEGKVNELRHTFYRKNNSDKEVNNIIETLNKAMTNSEYDAITDAEWNYIFACDAIASSNSENKFAPAPVDVCLAMANTEEALKKLKDCGGDDIVDGVDLDSYKIKDFDKSRVQKALDAFTEQDKNFDVHLVYLFTRMYSEGKMTVKNEKSESSNENKRILTSKQFITEEMIQNTMTLREANVAILDVLDECEDGCMYVGNIPGAEEVDYIMMDGDGGWGFYRELGNIRLALENGTPQEVEPITFSDSETLDILNSVFEKLSEEMIKEN